MTLVSPTSIRFEFVGYGEHVSSPTENVDRLYLDVGNGLGPGVIDHHHLAAYSGSAASLVLAHPDLVADSVNPSRDEVDPFTIVLHRRPDLDCLASAYLAVAYLTSGAFPQEAEALARYVDRVDTGFLGMSQDNPFSLYSACMLLAHRLSLREWDCDSDLWRELVKEALEVLDFVVGKIAEEKTSILEIDAFLCPGHFGVHDREDVQRDADRYRRKLSDPKTCARTLKLRLPSQFGGTSEVDALLVRDVQNPDDPERVMFFKDWARTDRELSASKTGFAALCVFEPESPAGPRQGILSVKPDSGLSLAGLGDIIDHEEAAERIQRYGCDDRLRDPETHEEKKPRPGFPNADPWYDGRGNGYTIVASPRSGTLLSAERIEEIFIEFGHRTEAEVEPLQLPSPAEVTDSAQVNEDTLRQLSFLVGLWQQEKAIASEGEPPEIFISYPRTKLDWVKAHIYEPLRAWRGEEKVFFDTHSINPGVGWMDSLAAAVGNCRVFLPVYCEDYFRSDFCQWELQLAVIRDPRGKRQILVPVMMEQVDLPGYCSLIQAMDAAQGEIKDRLVTVLGEILC